MAVVHEIHITDGISMADQDGPGTPLDILEKHEQEFLLDLMNLFGVLSPETPPTDNGEQNAA